MESIIYVGMDVHKDSYSLCCYDPKRDLFFYEMQVKSETRNVIKYLEHVLKMNDGAITLCGYEAGPTGFRLCRELQKKDFACVVMAPTSIAKSAKDKLVKTDRADAKMLAKTLAAKQYKEVELPTEHIESIKEINLSTKEKLNNIESSNISAMNSVNKLKENNKILREYFNSVSSITER